MSIRINADLEYLIARLNIPPQRLEEYQDKSVQEIIESEAALGNQAAINLAADMFTNVSSLIELFRLADPENKLVIINAMSDSQKRQLLPMLETEDLVEGLNFFTQSSLLSLLKDIPKEEMLKAVFQMFSQAQIVEFMPEKELDKFLTSDNLDKGLLMENLRLIPDTYLKQILESVTGEEAQGNSSDLLRQIEQLNDMKYKQALTNFEPAQKQQLVLNIASQRTRLFEQFDTDEYTKIINRERDKDETVKSMQVIKPEYLQKMIEELPQDLMSVVITQIDTEKFANALITMYPQLLAQFVAG